MILNIYYILMKIEVFGSILSAVVGISNMTNTIQAAKFLIYYVSCMIFRVRTPQIKFSSDQNILFVLVGTRNASAPF